MIDRIKDIFKAHVNHYLYRFEEGAVHFDDSPFEKRTRTSSRNSGHSEKSENSRRSQNTRQQKKSKTEEQMHYENLEVPYGSSFNTIKKSYKRLAMEYHPDKFHADDKKHRVAQEVMQSINTSYNYFKNKK